ncbi:MAG: hypothetical protein M3P96_12355 [Actinomycetota bacterium]|nr:hypothetical protein [Actinomycetota bacterium]
MTSKMSPSQQLREVRQRLHEVTDLLAELQSEIQEIEIDVDETPTAKVDEVTLRRARFLKGFVDAGGELDKETTYQVATSAGYPDMRGIAGWFNGENATLRWNPTRQMNELTGQGYEYWRELKGVLDES